MKFFLVSIVLSAAVACSAQTVANTHNVLHPLTKNGHGRRGISSLDSDPALSEEYRNPGPAAYGETSRATRPVAASRLPTKIDPNLNPSSVSLLGTVDGLRGKLSIENTGARTITPMLQLAVINAEGFAIGYEMKPCKAIAPNGKEQVDVLATNLGAVDLKVVRLTPELGGR